MPPGGIGRTLSGMLSAGPSPRAEARAIAAMKAQGRERRANMAAPRGVSVVKCKRNRGFGPDARNLTFSLESQFDKPSSNHCSGRRSRRPTTGGFPLASTKMIDVRRGMVLNMNGQLWYCLDRDLNTPGNWRAILYLKLKNLKTGSIVDERV